MQIAALLILTRSDLKDIKKTKTIMLVNVSKKRMLKFTTVTHKENGIIASLLRESYAELIESDYEHWGAEEEKWREFDKEAFENLETIGRCVFLSWSGDDLVGFASFDPRQKPEYGIVGHNCILPRFRRNGFGKQQIIEVLKRLHSTGIETALVSTSEHPFFLPAQHMYLSCGFQKKGYFQVSPINYIK